MPEDPSAVSRDSVVVEDVDPAAVTGDGRGEVLQQNVRIHKDAGDTKENHLQDLEPAQAPDVLQEFMKGHGG